MKKNDLPPMPGYTLLESMIAVLIIGLLATMAAPSLQNARNTARDQQAAVDCQLIGGAVEQLAWDTAQWPGGEAISYTITVGNELSDLNTTNAGLIEYGAQFDSSEWKGPYISTIPVDPWGTKYFFDADYTLVEDGNTTATVVGSLGVNKGTLNTYNDTRFNATGGRQRYNGYHPGKTDLSELDNIIDIIKRY